MKKNLSISNSTCIVEKLLIGKEKKNDKIENSDLYNLLNL